MKNNTYIINYILSKIENSYSKEIEEMLNMMSTKFIFPSTDDVYITSSKNRISRAMTTTIKSDTDHIYVTCFDDDNVLRLFPEAINYDIDKPLVMYKFFKNNMYSSGVNLYVYFPEIVKPEIKIEEKSKRNKFLNAYESGICTIKYILSRGL